MPCALPLSCVSPHVQKKLLLKIICLSVWGDRTWSFPSSFAPLGHQQQKWGWWNINSEGFDNTLNESVFLEFQHVSNNHSKYFCHGNKNKLKLQKLLVIFNSYSGPCTPYLVIEVSCIFFWPCEKLMNVQYNIFLPTPSFFFILYACRYENVCTDRFWQKKNLLNYCGKVCLFVCLP